MTLRMTPKRWFWSILAASLLWSVLGHRWKSPDPINQPTALRRVQDGVARLPSVLLVPAEWCFKLLEGAAITAIERVSSPPTSAATREELEDQIRGLQAQVMQFQGLLAQANEQLGALQHLPAGVTPQDVLEATFISQQPGPGAAVIKLDKGSMDGVKVGMAVIAPLQQATILGRVYAVGQKDCQVRLLTDQQMVVKADIVRPDGTLVTPERCTVVGLGGNQMQCTTVGVPQLNLLPTPPTPSKGDMVRLVDPSFPANTQFLLIGFIDSAAPRQDQALRYDIRISPPRPITALKTVMIVTKG
jgi:cell shape-determining protein MreC